MNRPLLSGQEHEVHIRILIRGISGFIVFYDKNNKGGKCLPGYIVTLIRQLDSVEMVNTATGERTVLDNLERH